MRNKNGKHFGSDKVKYFKGKLWKIELCLYQNSARKSSKTLPILRLYRSCASTEIVPSPKFVYNHHSYPTCRCTYNSCKWSPIRMNHTHSLRHFNVECHVTTSVCTCTNEEGLGTQSRMKYLIKYKCAETFM